jgi:CRP-like cAMP-binding protein
MRDARRTAGTALVEEGNVPTEVLYVRRGQVALVSRTSQGREFSCAVRGPGAMLGLEGLLGHSTSYEARALTDVTLCYIRVALFKEWIGPLDSPLGSVLLLSLEESVRRAGERQAVEGTALTRVARFLSQATDRGSDDGATIPHGVLASVLGMRAETLSRALAELRALGALAPGRKIHVVDARRLRLAAEG